MRRWHQRTAVEDNTRRMWTFRKDLEIFFPEAGKNPDALQQSTGYIYTMEYYSAIKSNDFMKFKGKWMELGNVMLSEVAKSQKTYMLCTHC